MRSGSEKAQRFLELDAVRGLAVFLMLVFHLSFDLSHFSSLTINLPHWFWEWMPEVIIFLFLIVLGVSSWVKYSTPSQPSPQFFYKRGLKLCLIAAGISFATFLYDRQLTVYFGALHCIGVSVLLCPFFLKHRKYNLIVSAGILSLGFFLFQYRFSFSFLLWLGFWPSAGAGGDYFPLIPYFGYVLLGIFLGEKLYPIRQEPLFSLSKSTARFLPLRFFGFLGTFSLPIYLIHQPLFIGLIQFL